jgi:hypothetical protein
VSESICVAKSLTVSSSVGGTNKHDSNRLSSHFDFKVLLTELETDSNVLVIPPQLYIAAFNFSEFNWAYFVSF